MPDEAPVTTARPGICPPDFHRLAVSLQASGERFALLTRTSR